MSQLRRIARFLFEWSPLFRDGGRMHCLGPRAYASLLWSRATRRPDPEPPREPVPVLHVPIQRRGYYSVGCVAWSMDDLTEEQRARLMADPTVRVTWH
jgi:hypothetical protein